MRRETGRTDHSEVALRWLAVGLGAALLVGAAACGGEQDVVETARAGETTPMAEPPTPPDTRTADPEWGGDTVSTDESREAGESPAASRLVSYGEAEATYHDGRFGEAVDLFTAYTAQKPDNAWGYYMLGLAGWKAGHLDVAETALRESVTRSPNHVKGHVNLSRVLIEQGRMEEALDHASIAEDMDPSSGQAKRTLARVLAETGDVEGAIAMYDEALRIDAEDVWSLNNLGHLLIQRGRHGEAVGPLALASGLDSDNSLFLNNLGSALEGVGYTVAAANVFETAAQLDSSNGKALASAERLRGVVGGGADPEVDVVALGNAFRETLLGTVADGQRVPEHGRGANPPAGIR